MPQGNMNTYKVIINYMKDSYGWEEFQSMYIVAATRRDVAKKLALDNFGNSSFETILQTEVKKLKVPKNGCVISGPHRP